MPRAKKAPVSEPFSLIEEADDLSGSFGVSSDIAEKIVKRFKFFHTELQTDAKKAVAQHLGIKVDDDGDPTNKEEMEKMTRFINEHTETNEGREKLQALFGSRFTITDAISKFINSPYFDLVGWRPQNYREWMFLGMIFGAIKARADLIKGSVEKLLRDEGDGDGDSQEQEKIKKYLDGLIK